MGGKPKELLVEVTSNGQWIFPDQKEDKRGWSPFMPISAMASMIASALGQHRKFGKLYRFKIVAIEQEGNEVE